jgi:DNA-binding response OmpR family regulator
MYRVLLIEDDQTFSDSLIENFEDEQKYIIDSCTDSLSALKKIKKNYYHLILLDYYLKSETGYDILKKIRDINKNIFICIITGYSDKITSKTAFEMDVQGYIDKTGGFINMANSIKSVIHSAYSAKRFSEHKEFFSTRLKKLREKNNLSQKELAEMLGVGRTAISNYENGLTEPSISMLSKMATIFQTSADYLIGRTD